MIVQQLFAQLLSFPLSQHFAQQLFLCRLDMQSTVAFDWINLATAGCPVVGREKLATGFPNDCSSLRLFLASVPAGPFAPADLSSSAEQDVVTDYIIIDGPLRCSSWFSFEVPAYPSSSSSACSWFLSFQLIHYAPAGSTWPPPDYEQPTQLWTSPLLI
ncbi:histone-lysine N-methyltransferase ASHH1-like [Dorcoceras hygrometricum]|uniref:Histone-lysine N-methyltransferase ASHH1-like n=1 Tax=Dorcoceras hygrometricum TaxID=472368 RepID=A0A2Z7A3I6_9LAMI|nr:histone-lysine N-methyltransferase ASHH1-like [Dorcoceras hygrometricum]